MRLLPIIFLIAFLGGAISAQSSESNMQSALNQMQSESQSFLFVTSLVFLALGLVLCAIASVVYLLKIKGKDKRIAWIAMALICGAFGLLFLAGGALGIILGILTPSIVNGMVSG